jgi:Tfp pilus assembly protein PilO
MEPEAAMKTENRQKFLMILTAAVVGLWLADLLVLEPLGHWWKTRSQSIVDLKNDVKHGKAMIANEYGIRNQWTNMRTNMLPNNISLAEQQAFKAFDNWAQQSGASLTGIMPQWKNDSTNYMTLNCRVEASGTIATLGSFLYKIEKGPMALKLDSVELSAHDTTGQQLTLGLQISGLALTSSNLQ